MGTIPGFATPNSPSALQRVERLNRRRAWHELPIPEVEFKPRHSIDMRKADAIRMVAAADIEPLEPDDRRCHFHLFTIEPSSRLKS